MKERYVVLDTSVVSENLGDFIIMDAVFNELVPLIKDKQMITMPTHANIGKRGRKQIRQAEFALVGGTNILTSHALKYRQWKFSLRDLTVMDNALLVGVGWWKYQDEPDFWTKKILRRLLSSRYQHSVRDEHTRKQLAAAGVNNVINTGCPTMWKLTPEHCAQIPQGKGRQVVFTLTDYRQAPEDDRALINALLEHYEHVFFWPQGIGDRQYFATLGVTSERLETIAPSLQSYDLLLSAGADIDYVGTRLHGGIRALQHKRRTIILEVDNRAAEKAQAFNLKVVPRNDHAHLSSVIGSQFPTEIRLDQEAIHRFKAQFGRES